MSNDRDYVQMKFTVHKNIFGKLTRIRNHSGLKSTEEARIGLAKYVNEHPVTIKFEQEQLLKKEQATKNESR